ncbi:hypothetical protein B0H19DRAFT_1276432 [Mycena capillaripes]|nr:hypothetical protein B0H19DRAFT_1276432 [Mycena capillaripes]
MRNTSGASCVVLEPVASRACLTAESSALLALTSVRRSSILGSTPIPWLLFFSVQPPLPLDNDVTPKNPPPSPSPRPSAARAKTRNALKPTVRVRGRRYCRRRCCDPTELLHPAAAPTTTTNGTPAASPSYVRLGFVALPSAASTPSASSSGGAFNPGINQTIAADNPDKFGGRRGSATRRPSQPRFLVLRRRGYGSPLAGLEASARDVIGRVPANPDVQNVGDSINEWGIEGGENGRAEGGDAALHEEALMGVRVDFASASTRRTSLVLCGCGHGGGAPLLGAAFILFAGTGSGAKGIGDCGSGQARKRRAYGTSISSRMGRSWSDAVLAYSVPRISWAAETRTC